MSTPGAANLAHQFEARWYQNLSAGRRKHCQLVLLPDIISSGSRSEPFPFENQFQPKEYKTY
jgi:hypothetical protein